MKIETYDFWPYGDWRPPARRAGWVLLTAAIGQQHRVPLPTVLFTLAVDMAVLSIVTFGLLTPVLVFVVEGAVDFLFALDAVAFALSEWIVCRVMAEARGLVRFLASFGVEILLVRVALLFWNAAHMGPRVLLGLQRMIQ